MRRHCRLLVVLLTALWMTLPEPSLRSACAFEESLPVHEFAENDAASLQRFLLQYAGQSCIIRLPKEQSLTCAVREDKVGSETSIHALLIPEHVQLDLNQGTLLLDLRSNSYGIRLSNHSAIRNGTVCVIHSEGKGAQGCWHSAVSVGAAYGDGGTVERPGHFSTVTNWVMEDLLIDQQVDASAVQLMSEACHGVIRNIRIADSEKALLGIGMDWGSVGDVSSADERLSEMQELWKKRQIYTTHPHDILVENIEIGRLTRNSDPSDAGVRCSACHRITIRNVSIDTAATAIAIWGGDCGYEFARDDQRNSEHIGYVLENITIQNALRFGLILNGTADNIVRAERNLGYKPLRNPAVPGIQGLRAERLQLTGTRASGSQGIYAVAVTSAEMKGVQISQFTVGLHAEDWVNGLRLTGDMVRDNERNLLLEGTFSPASDVTLESVDR
jgi:hypothetical protein